MDYEDTVALLRRVPIFASMEAAALKLLAFSSETVTFDDGEIICQEGDLADGVYVIDEGQVVVSVERDGIAAKIAVVGANEVVGELAVILNQPRAASLRAQGTVRLVRIDSDIFIRTVTGNPDAALGVLRILCRRLSNMLRHYEELVSSIDSSI
ncbi:MAG: cyclic nucleotide-binding domain-containing protein [Rhodospirillales bacterium]|nr:cyclic nucleotide-binding domain-containing protein [Rhodospirillales bacterium]